MQLRMDKLGALLIVSCALAISTSFCAPTQQQASTLKASPSNMTPSTTTATAKLVNPSTTTLAPRPVSMAPAATTSIGSSSVVNMKNSIPAPEQNMDSMDTFDGKNPFADDSLWQIPVHLVRDLTAGGLDDNQPQTLNENMAKSASETSPANLESDAEDDDDLIYNPHNQAANVPQQTSSSPTIISASTDLKTAAGYHYPTGHHHHSGYHSSHGGYHPTGGHGDHHYHGKYYQYVNVPSPYSYEFGYRRGNPYHTIERHEKRHGPHFNAKVKWHDKNGYGVHYYDFNHDDHHSHHYGGNDHYDSHGSGHHGHHGHHGGHHGHY